jgi:hypothetical protein
MYITKYLLAISLLFFTIDAIAQPVTLIEPDEINYGDVGIGRYRNINVTVTNVRYQDELAVWAQLMGDDSIHYQCIEPATEAARNTLLAINIAIVRYNLNNGEDPSSVDDLVQGGYLQITDEVDRMWNFDLLGREVVQIEAESTDEMPF